MPEPYSIRIFVPYGNPEGTKINNQKGQKFLPIYIFPLNVLMIPFHTLLSIVLLNTFFYFPSISILLPHLQKNHKQL